MEELKGDYTAREIFDNLPSFFKAADEASKKGQNTHLQLIRTDLLVMILGTIFAGFSGLTDETNVTFLVVCSVFIGIGTLITIVLSKETHKKQWYIGRAVAESIKALAWRYMMRAGIFEGPADSQEIDKSFVDEISKIFSESELSPANHPKGKQITQVMERIRRASLAQRKLLFCNARIDDQQEWYSNRSIQSNAKKNMWFMIIAGAQILTLVASVYIISNPSIPFNPTGILSTIAASGLAWLQVKKHEELAMSYFFASIELGKQSELVKSISEEKEFSNFVANTEAAISREHKVWLAQRDPKHALTSSIEKEI